MILSNELQSQVTRFSKTRSCSMDSQLKNELALLLFQIKGTRLNKSCGTCIRNAMQDLINYMQNTQNTQKTVAFVGIKQVPPVNFDNMTYKELKELAGVKGNIKREVLIEMMLSK
jgi:hypothetical protein